MKKNKLFINLCAKVSNDTYNEINGVVLKLNPCQQLMDARLVIGVAICA